MIALKLAGYGIALALVVGFCLFTVGALMPRAHQPDPAHGILCCVPGWHP